MSRQNCHPPHHESPHETRVVRAVEAAGVSDEERPCYLIFARELDLSLRHKPQHAGFPGDSPEEQTLGTVNVGTVPLRVRGASGSRPLGFRSST